MQAYRKFGRMAIAMMAMVLSLAALAAVPANAAKTTYTVTSLLDDGSAGTLRWAIDQVQAGKKPAVINFDSTLFGDVSLAAPLPAVTGRITINGNFSIWINGNTGFRIFRVGPSGNLTLNQIGLGYGRADASDGLVGGGAVYNEGTLTLNECDLFSNEALFGGGAIANGGSVTIINCGFYDNLAEALGADCGGGAIYSLGGSMTVSGTDFEQNKAVSYPTETSAKGYSGGGAIVYDSSASPLVLFDCEFGHNRAGVNGGAVMVIDSGVDVTLCDFNANVCIDQGPTATSLPTFACGGGALFVFDQQGLHYPARLSQSSFWANWAFSETEQVLGGAAAVTSPLTVSRCEFSWNYAVSTAPVGQQTPFTAAGGALIAAGEPTLVADSLFTANAAGFPTAAPPLGPSAGGGIAANSAAVLNCTISGNSASSGSAFATAYGLLGNCIVWANTNGTPGSAPVELLQQDGQILITYSDVQGCGGSGSGWLYATSLTDGGGNIDADPMFDTYFDLLVGSPCIDAGSNALMAKGSKLDLNGYLRISGKSVDMGAFEYQYPKKK